ncbi:MAG: hypothetical protein JWQ58_2646 [Reyranella sp.]|nr:hypothetical protein [Reyranella sp.]
MIKIAPLKKYALRAERPASRGIITESYQSLARANERKTALEADGYTVLVTLSDPSKTK